MKHIKSILLVLIVSYSYAQDTKLLIQKNEVSDLSSSPLYSKLTQKVNDKIEWKDAYKYIDSINIYEISYLSDGLKINGYVVTPKKTGTFPSIIYNRGGSNDFGSLTSIHAAILLGEIAKEGYVVIASQYRGNAGSEGKEEFGGEDINDVTILPKVLEEIEEADTESIGMYGWSRGGMMTYLALTKSDRIKAVVIGGAVSNAHKMIEDRPEMETEVLAKLIPNYYKNKEEELKKRSAIKWVDEFPKNVPILMLHGNVDWRVKPEQSLNMALEFEKYRIPYRLIMFEGSNHGITEHKNEVNEQVINWFNKYLKNNESLPNMEYHGK